MAKLEDVFAHRGDFTPNTPRSEADMCKCPECGQWTQFKDWSYHGGIDSGHWCDACDDFHSCFECPSCHAYLGAAGVYHKPIEVQNADAERAC